MIEFTEEADVLRLPDAGTFQRLTLQPRWRVTNGENGPRLVLEWEGGADALLVTGLLILAASIVVTAVANMVALSIAMAVL